MNIYTSYFSNYKNFPDNTKKIQIVNIPIKSDLEHWPELAPSNNLLKRYKNKEIDEYIFSVLFQIELTERFGSQEECLKWMNKKGQGQDLLLCCYEPSGQFCHRHVLTHWLGTGTEI